MAYVFANPPAMTATSARPLRGCRVRMRLGAFNYASSGPVRRLPGGIIWNSPGPGRARVRLTPLPPRPPLVDGVYNTPYYVYPFNPPAAPAAVQSAQPIASVTPAAAGAAKTSPAPQTAATASTATSAAAPAATGTSIMSFVSSIPWWGWGAAAVGGFLLWKGVSK